MSEAFDPAAAARWVVWGGLVLGLVFGGVGQASRFCIRGGVADWMIFRGPGRLFSWWLAVAVGAIGVQVLIAGGQFDATRAVVWSDRLPWLSCIAGGFVFGWGMMLAAGCPQRCLVKAGQGDLRALVTLIVLAVVALMTLRGAFAELRVDALDRFSLPLGRPQDLGSLISGAGLGPASIWRGVLVVAMVACVAWFGWRHRASIERGHWGGGLVVGLLVPAAFYLTGRIGFVAEHPETLEPAWLGTQSRRPEGLSFSAPLAHTLDLLTLWSDKATVATFGVMLSLGVLAGSFIVARLRGDFRIEAFTTPRELGEHLVGALMMGFGGVTAVGCSIGNGVTGLAMLSGGAVLAMAGMMAGAVLAVRRQAHLARPDEALPPMRQPVPPL